MLLFLYANVWRHFLLRGQYANLAIESIDVCKIESLSSPSGVVLWCDSLVAGSRREAKGQRGSQEKAARKAGRVPEEMRSRSGIYVMWSNFALCFQAAKDAQRQIPPAEMFRRESEKYSQFDEQVRCQMDNRQSEMMQTIFDLQGVPTHDVNGDKLSESLRKKLKKQQQVQEKLYSDYLRATSQWTQTIGVVIIC